MSALRRFVLVTALAVSAACGTTVPLTSQQSLGADVSGPGTGTAQQQSASQGSTGLSPAQVGSGLTPASGSAGGLSGGISGGTSPTGPAGTSTQATGGTASSGTGTASAPAIGTVNRGPLPAKGFGWDSKYVYLGVVSQKDAQQAYKTAGYSGIDPGDTRAQAQAVADHLNAQGGVFGRQVKIEMKDVATVASAENPDAAADVVCTYFSQDRPVIAVFSIVVTMDVASFRECLAKHKIPLFSSADTAVDSRDAARLAPYFYSEVAPAWDALAPVLVSRLKAQGFFTGWNPQLGKPGNNPVKIGVLILDNPLGARIGNIIKQALKAQGYSNVITFAYGYPGNNIGPAVTNFSGNGVTHVISADIELSAFQTYAAPQHYIPRYGIHTYNDPYTNLSLVAPASQQVGDIGVGWAPTYDVSDQQDPGIKGPGEQTCLALMKKGGVTYSDRWAKANAMPLCDTILLATQGAVAGEGLSPDALYQGILKVSPKFSSAFAFATGLTANRLFVPGAVRDLRWNTTCSCFAYASKSNLPM